MASAIGLFGKAKNILRLEKSFEKGTVSGCDGCEFPLEIKETLSKTLELFLFLKRGENSNTSNLLVYVLEIIALRGMTCLMKIE